MTLVTFIISMLEGRKLLKLYSDQIIDPELGFHFSDIRSINDTSKLHEHDFYEFFVTYGGAVYHLINGEKELLPEGSFVFIRPSDSHAYEKLAVNDCQIMNVAFSEGTVGGLQQFLGTDHLLSDWILRKHPPQAVIPLTEAPLLKERFRKLLWSAGSEGRSPDTQARFKVLLTEVLFRYLSKFQQS